MFTKYDKQKLLDDMKILSRAIQVVADENNDKKRQYAKELAMDIGCRIINDIEEMTKGFKPPEEYPGVEARFGGDDA